MNTNDVTDLLDHLAATAPEPSRDAVAEVHRRVRRTPRRSLLPATIALATLTAVLVAMGLVLVVGRSPAPTPPAAQPGEGAALDAGREFAELFFSPDYRTIQQYSAEMAARTLGQFRADFIDKQDELAQTTAQSQHVASGRVLAAAARDVTPTSATVLVVADQTVSSSGSGEQPPTNRFRATAALRLVDGQWLVQDFVPDLGGSGTGCADGSATPERSELLRQTCLAVERLYSFDYRTLDADLAARRMVTTPAYAAVLPRDPGAPRIDPQAGLDAPLHEARSFAAAAVSDNGRTADVLVFADQTRALAEPEPGGYRPDVAFTPQRLRLVVSMQLVEGRWLVDGVRTL